MKQLLFITLFILYIVEVNGQSDSTLINFSDLIFNSEMEKSAFEALNTSDNFRYFNLALYSGTGNPDKILAEYQSYFGKIKQKLNEEAKADKKVKIIYKSVHSDLLKKYELYCDFKDIFSTGTYNCVSASLLYSLILDDNNLSYQVKETENHVYLVALPEAKSVMLESTNPSVGYYVYNGIYKSKFVDYLKTSKVVTAEEIQSKGVDSLFNKYYFATSTINQKNLIGLIYYNKGLSAIEKEDYKNSLNELMKSYYLYPSKKVEYLMIVSLANLIQKADYNDSTNWKYFAYLTRSKLFSKEEIKDEFLRVTSQILYDKSNFKLYEKAFQKIYPALRDTNAQKEVGFIFHYESGRYFAVSNNFKEAFNHYDQAYWCKPDHYEIQDVLCKTFFAAMAENMSENEGIDNIEKFYYTHTNLKNNLIIEAMLSAYLYRANQNFLLNNWQEGEKYLVKFETFMDQHPDSKYKAYMIGEVYKKPAAHLFKLNKIKDARAYILRGLKYSPDDYNLKSSLEMLK